MGTHKIYRGIQYRTNILGSLYGDCHELLAKVMLKLLSLWLVPSFSQRLSKNAWLFWDIVYSLQ